MNNNLHKLIIFLFIFIPHKCFGEIIDNCINIKDDILCLSNDFSYNYSVNIDEINKRNFPLINFDDCQFFYENSHFDKSVCDKYIIKKNKKYIDFVPKTKQFFTSINLGLYSENKHINFNLLNGYSPFIGKSKIKNFYQYWTASKNNFKFEKNSIHVVCPVINQQAIMSFNKSLNESFIVTLDIRSSNIKVIASPIIVINKELFIYFANEKFISIDFPQKLKLKTKKIKVLLDHKYSIRIIKKKNDLELYLDNNMIYNGKNIIEKRQWSSFEIRIAAKSSSFYIDNLLIY